ncbi:tRNA lysidine(34) synthetase TilS [Methylobacterium sp. J-076]|uniref:tRNA lysidine(34) synthetase TilS n=1 Tax=Methylobacterium sp. J-076 TaxID=2836655 RepID=UPI001FB86C14|nr:tRNA lysidine(34) synthetase TilS [Methylobacterium sp. J-076]MCJ2013466.1 tRNA lysidine(34) synthetase TilS [Methylobacterium sp. J-076]
MTGADDPVLAALRPWLRPGRAKTILLAVSGGPDSRALLHASAALRPAVPLAVATVDHGLRAEAADEAAAVGRAATGLGLPHAVLAWRGAKPASGLQDAARTARYRLLTDHAALLGADLVLTAHTRDDQAETVLMRLAAGSAPAGLAGMRPERELAPGLRLGRPFLGLGKAALVGWCEAQGIPFVRDPSNADGRYARARLRSVAAALAAEGLTSTRLARLAARAARDDEALRQATGEALDRMLLPAQGGTVRLDGTALSRLPEAVALRCVDRAIDRAGGNGHRLERLEALVLDVLLPALRLGRPMRRTLAGLIVSADAAGTVTLLCAPPRKNAGPAAPATGLLGNEDPPAYIGDA